MSCHWHREMSVPRPGHLPEGMEGGMDWGDRRLDRSELVQQKTSKTALNLGTRMKAKRLRHEF